MPSIPFTPRFASNRKLRDAVVRKRVDVTDDHAVRGIERCAIRQPGPDRTREMRRQESLLRIAGRSGTCSGDAVGLLPPGTPFTPSHGRPCCLLRELPAELARTRPERPRRTMLRVAESIGGIDQPHVRRGVARHPAVDRRARRLAAAAHDELRRESRRGDGIAQQQVRTVDDAVGVRLARAQARGGIGEHRPVECRRERMHGIAEHRIPAVRSEDQHAPLDAAQFLRESVEIGQRAFTILQCE